MSTAGQRLAREVYQTETTCWFCHELVDKTLPKYHPRSKTAHHIVELQDGGPVDRRDNLALAHRECNIRAGAKRQAERARGGQEIEMSADLSSL